MHNIHTACMVTACTDQKINKTFQGYIIKATKFKSLTLRFTDMKNKLILSISLTKFAQATNEHQGQ